MMQDQDRKRAEQALKLVDEIKTKDAKLKKEYRSLVLNIGPMILQSGLAATLGYLISRSGGAGEQTPHGIVLNHLSKRAETAWADWLKNSEDNYPRNEVEPEASSSGTAVRSGPRPAKSSMPGLLSRGTSSVAPGTLQPKGEADILVRLLRSPEMYRPVAADLTAFAGWLKRFTEAQIGTGK